MAVSVAFDTEPVFELVPKWHQFCGEHGNELLGVLPPTHVVVDLIKEVLSADAEILETAFIRVFIAAVSVVLVPPGTFVVIVRRVDWGVVRFSCIGWVLIVWGFGGVHGLVRRFICRFVVGFVVGFVVRFVIWFVVRFVVRFVVGFVIGFIIGFVVRLVCGLVWGLVRSVVGLIRWLKIEELTSQSEIGR